MPTAILGKKIGMTRYYDGDGNNVPVTVIEAGPCFVSQIKTEDTDGYHAVQIAYEDIRPSRSTLPEIGHDAKAGVSPKRFRREVRSEEAVADLELGQSITVEAFESVKFVDVTGTSKGKGTAGVMKRHNFRGQEASHGVERKHRSPGSVGGRSSNLGTGKPKKGIRMAGRMGNERVTVRSLPVVGIDKERNLLLVKGPIPGPKSGLVMVREAKRLFKRKARQLEA
ncbi:50S ribosomal protein L3 [Mucisphaera calidilacus]|uniref:Large ribosomal subunit protein uL3 n=1 Tax=Mucisphaera calidilacus TaxID=2527982 RepID=A0A518BXU3_9BACT|nr:50S ribosomal protein L3 [Mucisphaera calidilacus]QDU71776.1 50S ribosomal protein L3 [Mucisphaera calidilacus]